MPECAMWQRVSPSRTIKYLTLMFFFAHFCLLKMNCYHDLCWTLWLTLLGGVREHGKYWRIQYIVYQTSSMINWQKEWRWVLDCQFVHDVIASVCVILLFLSRPEPHRASLRLPGEDQPHAELLLQQRGSRGEDVATPGRELRPKARRDRWHERWPSALWEGEHGGIQYSRPTDPPGADREAGRRGVSLLGRVGG